jgi:hypothetical protein
VVVNFPGRGHYQDHKPLFLIQPLHASIIPENVIQDWVSRRWNRPRRHHRRWPMRRSR